MGTQVLNCFTVDVEDYFHICGLPDYADPCRWEQMPSRVEANTKRTLDLLDRHGVKATFFLLAWITERYPSLVQEIAARGHEIASHGCTHRLVYEQSREEFREDLKRSIQILEQTTGQKVLGFRASSFSITEKCLWALDIIAELGLKYDASLFPAPRQHGGIIGEKPFLHERHCASGRTLWEFPMSTVRILGRSVPFTGGGYLRLFPVSWIRRWVRQINAKGNPAIFYIHPRELDPEQPRLPMPLSRRFRCYYNLGKTESKLSELLPHFRFERIRDVLGVQPLG